MIHHDGVEIPKYIWNNTERFWTETVERFLAGNDEAPPVTTIYWGKEKVYFELYTNNSMITGEEQTLLNFSKSNS